MRTRARERERERIGVSEYVQYHKKNSKIVVVCNNQWKKLNNT